MHIARKAAMKFKNRFQYLLSFSKYQTAVSKIYNINY